MKEVILAGMFFFLCGYGLVSEEIDSLIPEDVDVYCQIGNLDEMFVNLDAFLVEIGLRDKLTSGVSLKEFARSTLAIGGFDIDWIDFSKPAGIGGWTSKESLFRKFDIVVAFPVKNISENAEKIESLIATEEIITKKYGNYLLLFTNIDTADKYPLKNKFNQAKFSKYQKGGLSLYYNVGELWKSSGMDFAMMKKEFRDSVITRNPGLKNKELLFYFADRAIEIAEQISEGSSGIFAEKRGFTCSGDLEFDRTGWVHEFLSSLTPVKGTREFIKYLPDDYLLTGIANINPLDLKEAFHKFEDILYGSYENISKSDIASLKKMSEDCRNLQGSRCAIALDFNLNFKGILALTDYSDITNYFDLDGVIVAEIKNGKSYRKKVEEFFLSRAYKHLLKESAANTGVGVKVNFQARKTKDGFKYDVLEFDLDLSEMKGLPELDVEEREKFDKFISVLAKKLKVYMYFAEKRCYLTMGSDALRKLRGLASKDEYPGKGLKGSTVAGIFLKTVSNSDNLFYQLSLKKIVSLLNPPVAEDFPEESPGLVGRINATRNASLFSSLFLSSKEIAVLINLSETLLNKLF